MANSDNSEKFEKNAEGSQSGGKNSRNDDAPVKWYKRPVFRKTMYLVVSLVIAMTLWGYVLMSENPAREKRVENVPVSFTGLKDSLAVCGNLDELIPDVTVTIQTTLNDLPRLNQENVSGNIVRASVSAANVNSAGEQKLYITAESTIGTVISVSPSTVTLKFDNVVEKRVPISSSFVGELPEGYWHSDPQLDSSSIVIEGAESEIMQVAKASCVISLSDRTESIYNSFVLDLFDKDGNPVDASIVMGAAPSVTVKMDILPYKTLEIKPTIVGTDQLPDILEIADTTVTPSTLSVAASRDVLDSLEGMISVTPIDISDVNKEGTLTFEVAVDGLPESVRLLADNHFTVTVTINERIEEKVFESMPIRIINENENNENYGYSYSTTTCDVTLRGKAGIIRQIYSWTIKITLNMSGFGPGTYTLTPELEFLNIDENSIDIDYIEYLLSTVDVVITPNQAP